jgi:hypothetical protein
VVNVGARGASPSPCVVPATGGVLRDGDRYRPPAPTLAPGLLRGASLIPGVRGSDGSTVGRVIVPPLDSPAPLRGRAGS